MQSNQVRDLSNPVWDIYDEFCTARLNVKDHSVKLAHRKNLNTAIELTLAIATPSSAAAALWFWDTQFGRPVWQYVGALAVILAVTKPILRLTDKIQAYEERLTGYRQLECELHAIALRISQKRRYDRAAKARFDEAVKKKGALAEKPLELNPDKRLIRTLRLEIETELPPENFYIPQ
jgi:hypothetical protein